MVFLHSMVIPDAALVMNALQRFYGIGPNVAARICARLTIHRTARLGELSQKQLTSVQQELSKLTIENDLHKSVVQNIQRLKDMGNYRGKRHAMGLPVRGQQTQTQVKTAERLNRVERGRSMRYQKQI
ncbi:hypothetical protein DRE_01271 [Drechslerella stenobrocha 248]|uniref:Mitochondrial 37S ribosomal protein SWS2 n=1 Tax=Drechslerella stenobrocha 248 TaxID=1043628 RepID=W7HLG9_9PEZI|nr:hypothetical protein DRE_01271 [Drechslerella stenobrocha 248]